MILPAVFLCLISVSLASDEGACYVTSEMEDECGSVFYPIVKPLLRYFEVCQTKDRRNAELQDSLDEINLKYSKLLEKHVEVHDKLNEENIKYRQLQESHTAAQREYHKVEVEFAEVREKWQLTNRELDKSQKILNETNLKNEQLQSRLVNVNRQNARLQGQNQNKDEELRSLRAQISQQAAQITRLQDQTSELGKLKDLFSEEIAKLRDVVKSGSGTEPNEAENNATIAESGVLAKNEATNTTHFNSTQVDLPDRCPSTQNGIFVYPEIHFPGLEPFQVVCFSNKDVGSGWMEVFSKYYYSTKFNQTYDQYLNGFGDVRQQHFIGLEKLHILTSQKPHEMYITYFTPPSAVFRFYRNMRVICENFVVGDRSEGYSLKQIDGCRGDTSLFNLTQGTKFSTFDRDLDGNPDHNWAQELGHGFWFGSEKPIWNSRTSFRLYIRRKD
ncbi:angiopoietin-4-like [Drosophila ananassae]|uniref:angiopoietin-4-like n=1 Tax=Drosophila ananassae TaxID=7217 RepID=UPI001CFFAB8D|nr:angiopoietin-4-like [Drosophila ananassae]